MEVFEGTVRLAGDSTSLQARLLVGDNRLKVKTNQHELGDWDLSELSSRMRPDGCHIVAEGEELIVTVDEPKRLAEAIGPRVTNPGDGSLLGTDTRSEASSLDRVRRTLGSTWRAVPVAGRFAVVAILVAGVLFATAPLVLVGLTMVSGLVGLIAGGYAHMDSFTAVRLPHPLTPLWLMRGGAGLLGAAIILAIIT